MVSPQAINEMQNVDVTSQTSLSKKGATKLQIEKQLGAIDANNWVGGRPHAESGSSFEDLGKDFEEIKKQDAQEYEMIPQKPEQSVTKFVTSGTNKVIIDDYLQQVKYVDERVDWFNLYNSKQFNFRNTDRVYKKVKKELNYIAPVSQFYDFLQREIENPQSNIKIQQSVMMSCIDMGTSEEEKNFSKLQIAQR